LLNHAPDRQQTLEFHASRRLHVAGWTDKEERGDAFGLGTMARYGVPQLPCLFRFYRSVDPATGMLINISEIKEPLGISSRWFRSQFLPRTIVVSRRFPPIRETLPVSFIGDVRVAVFGRGRKLSACH